MKLFNANRKLNLAGGVVLSLFGLAGWGVGAYALLVPLPIKPLPVIQPAPDAAECRRHAADLGFERFRAARGPGSARPRPSKPGEPVPERLALAAAPYAAAPNALDFTAVEGPEPQVQLEAASNLIARCAATLEYFCMGDGCKSTEGHFLRIVLSPATPVTPAAPPRLP